MKIRKKTLFTPALRYINLSYLSAAVVYLFPSGFILLHCSDPSSAVCWYSLPFLTYFPPPRILITQQNLRFCHVRIFFIYSSPSLFNLFPHLHVSQPPLSFLAFHFSLTSTFPLICPCLIFSFTDGVKHEKLMHRHGRHCGATVFASVILNPISQTGKAQMHEGVERVHVSITKKVFSKKLLVRGRKMWKLYYKKLQTKMFCPVTNAYAFPRVYIDR